LAQNTIVVDTNGSHANSFNLNDNPFNRGVQDRGVQDPDFRTRVRKDSAHFEQTRSDLDYGFVQVSGSGSRFSNFLFFGFDSKTIIQKCLQDLKDVI